MSELQNCPDNIAQSHRRAGLDVGAMLLRHFEWLIKQRMRPFFRPKARLTLGLNDQLRREEDGYRPMISSSNHLPPVQHQLPRRLPDFSTRQFFNFSRMTNAVFFSCRERSLQFGGIILAAP